MMSSSPVNYSNMNKKVFQKTSAENCEDDNEGGVAFGSLERVPTSISGVGHGSRGQQKTKVAMFSAGTMSPSLKNYNENSKNLKYQKEFIYVPQHLDSNMFVNEYKLIKSSSNKVS
jgi:hypothetical protein